DDLAADLGDERVDERLLGAERGGEVLGSGDGGVRLALVGGQLTDQPLDLPGVRRGRGTDGGDLGFHPGHRVHAGDSSVGADRGRGGVVPPVTLGELIPREPDPDSLYDAFAAWCSGRGLDLYPAQQDALIELFTGANVILATPTGSGKSLVATGAHFAALAEG